MEHTDMHTHPGGSIRSKFSGTTLALATALAFAIAAPAAEARADDAALAKYAGAYGYAKDKAHGEAIIDKAMDDALSQLNTVMKMVVKKAMAMRPGQKFMDKVWLETPSGQIGIKIGEYEKVVLKPGKPETVERDGRKGKVTHLFKGGKVLQTIEGEEGSISNTFTLAADGKTLHRDVKITSPRLQKPITYRLTYLRK